MVAISEKTYHSLAQMGTLEDTFDSVIQRMIDKEKVAASGQTLPEPARLQQPYQNDREIALIHD